METTEDHLFMYKTKMSAFFFIFFALMQAPEPFAQSQQMRYDPQPNLEKLDSVLKTKLGYETGKYWNTIWARYFALDDFKGIRTLYDPNIVRYNLYSKDFPLILINELPLVFYNISSIQFLKIKNATFTDTFSVAIRKTYPFLQYGVLHIEADLKDYTSRYVNIARDLPQRYKQSYVQNISPVGTASFLDSVLLAAIGLNRNQAYNLRIHEYFQGASRSNLKPIVHHLQQPHGLIPPYAVRWRDTAYYIFVDKAPLEFFDDRNWKFNTLKKGIVTGSTSKLQHAGDLKGKTLPEVRIDISVE